MSNEKAAGQGTNRRLQPKRTPTIEIKLSAADYIRFSELCRMEGKTRTDVARAAIRSYIDRSAEEVKDEERDKVVEALGLLHGGQKKDTERLAKMIARLMMDLGTLQQVFYERADKEIRQELWAVARKRAAERLAHKRKDGDPEATEIMKNALSGEA
jgi:hypothetical protein